MLREWAPLSDIFNSIPSKAKKGIFNQDVKLTCVDALPEFIALGTNLGVFYWYDRKRKHITELKCESSNIPLTSVKILSTVDYMVACGSRTGNVSIFQIPKSHPESIPENLKPRSKQIEKFIVANLHKSQITALEWSKNGMKLFSGDKNGCVVLTEIDFYMHICKSVEILNETYEVVQLSYNNHYLLVSTIYRSIICKKADKWLICQIGKKDRKVLGTFGGLIIQKGYKPSETFLYCARPRLRIWIADIEGNVQNTLLFKDLLTQDCPEVPIINPIPKNLSSLKVKKEPSFGIILPFNDHFLLTYNNDAVYILEPEKMIVITTISQIRGVIDVATCKDEIFILEEERSLIRISYNPEPEFNDSFNDSSCNTYLPLQTSIQDITEKLNLTGIKPVIISSTENPFSSNVNIYTDDTAVTYAEEATASPSDITAQKKFDDIGKQNFSEEILFKKKKNGRKRSVMTTSTTSISSNSSEEFCNTQYTKKVMEILSNERNQESISHEIESKEKLLADILSLNEVKIPSTIENETTTTLNKTNEGGSSYTPDFKSFYGTLSENTETISSNQKSVEPLINFHTPKDETTSMLNTKECNFNSDRSSTNTENKQKEIQQSQYSKHKLEPDKLLSLDNIDILKDKNKIQPSDKIMPSTSTKQWSTPQESSTHCDILPKYTNIPQQWNLSNIHIRDRTTSNQSENSLSDWEIV